MELQIRNLSKSYANGVHASDASPGAGFSPVEADLKDVYFSTMAGCHACHANAGGQPVLEVAR